MHWRYFSIQYSPQHCRAAASWADEMRCEPGECVCWATPLRCSGDAAAAGIDLPWRLTRQTEKSGADTLEGGRCVPEYLMFVCRMLLTRRLNDSSKVRRRELLGDGSRSAPILNLSTGRR